MINDLVNDSILCDFIGANVGGNIEMDKKTRILS